MQAGGPGQRSREPTYFVVLAVPTLVGLIVRIAAVAGAGRTLLLSGRLTDGKVFDAQANFLADGAGFVDAGRLALTFVAQPSAVHPPLFPLLLAGVSSLGFRSVLDHQLAAALFSAAAVPLIGMAAWEVAGSRAGLVAAGIAAVYPNLWAADAWVLSESLYVTAIALALWMLCRWWKAPSPWRSIWAGIGIALAALTRPEAIFLLPFAVAPLLAIRRGTRIHRALAMVAIVFATTFVVTAPWVIRNLTTFDRPVFLSDNSDALIGETNCAITYSGPLLGSWSGSCNAENLPHGDESVQVARIRARGIAYARAHPAKVPVVVAARIGRAWDLFRPLQGYMDVRSAWTRRFAVFSFYLLLPLAIYGLVLVRRQSISLVPFLAMPVVVTLTAALSYGLWRLRLPVDVTAIVLAGVALSHLSTRLTHPRSTVTPNSPGG